MPNIAGLYTALSGMNAQRRVLDVTAHNIANQTTEGYHRQRVELRPSGIGGVASVFAGQDSQLRGVDVVGVTRMIDQLAEDRFMAESARFSGAQAATADLSRIEQAFPEPSETGLASLLDDFWAGWSDLSMYPADSATRVQTLERATTVIDGLRRASADLDQVTATAAAAISTLSADVNDLATRIAQLNGSIAGGGSAANDLKDQRDLAVRTLAELTGAVARPADSGMISVSIGGRELVSGTFTHAVDGGSGVLTWRSDGLVVAAPSSRAAALMGTVTDVVPRYRALLDGVAQSLVTEVNAVHSAGYDQNAVTGWNFFDPAGVTAATISLSADVAGRPERLAAGAPQLPGPTAPGPYDGEQARAMAAIAGRIDGPNQRYRTMVAQLGVEVRAADRRTEIQSGVTRAAEARAQSTGGVSLDEEMASLMASQRAYQASARVLTTVDELLEVLIERTGRVGR